MFVVSGFFEKGSPALKIKISGVGPNSTNEFTAVIDTGFDGFISMPVIFAFPLGLTPQTSTEVEFADGSIQPKLVAEGCAEIENRKKTGLIILEESSSEILIGMDFLRTFKLMITMTSKSVLLMDESELEILAEETRTRISPQKSQPALSPPETEEPVTEDKKS
jgi:clan AA aspartic protease